MSTSIIIVQFGPLDLLTTMLDSLAAHDDAEVIDEVVVVDNGRNLSPKESKELESRADQFDIEVVQNDQESYASGVNEGASVAEGDVYIISNNDVKWHDQWSIRPLLEKVREERIGAVGPQLVNEDGSWQRSYGNPPSLKSALKSMLFIDSFQRYQANSCKREGSQQNKNVGYVDGAFLATPVKTFDELGGWDERYNFYAEDADYCYRVWQANERVVFQPASRIIHLGGATSSTQEPKKYSRQLAQSNIKFVRLHGGSKQAQLYTILMIIALLERYVIYTVLDSITNNHRVEARRQQTTNRFQAFLYCFI